MIQIRTIMAGVALIALALYAPILTTMLVLSVVSVLLIHSPRRDPVGSSVRSWALPYFVTLACLYLPFAWVLGDHPWDGYRQSWIRIWPILPGLIPGMLVHPNEAVEMVLCAVVSLALIVLFTSLGRRGRVSLIVSNTIALVGTTWESLVSYELFRF